MSLPIVVTHPSTLFHNGLRQLFTKSQFRPVRIATSLTEDLESYLGTVENCVWLTGVEKSFSSHQCARAQGRHGKSPRKGGHSRCLAEARGGLRRIERRGLRVPVPGHLRRASPQIDGIGRAWRDDRTSAVRQRPAGCRRRAVGRRCRCHCCLCHHGRQPATSSALSAANSSHTGRRGSSERKPGRGRTVAVAS